MVIVRPGFSPVLWMIWLIDLYVLLCGARLILSRVPTAWAGQACLTLQRFTDPLPNAVGRRIARRSERPPAPWLPWLLVGLCALLLRSLLIGVLL